MIIIPGYIDGLRTRKDKTLSITISTNELPAEKAAELMSKVTSFGWLAYKESEFNASDTDILEGLEADIYDKAKSPSKRLRAVMYVSFQQDNEGHTEFKDYYAAKMEKIIEHFKDKLDG